MQYIYIYIGLMYVVYDIMQVKLRYETSFGTFQR